MTKKTNKTSKTKTNKPTPQNKDETIINKKDDGQNKKQTNKKSKNQIKINKKIITYILLGVIIIILLSTIFKSNENNTTNQQEEQYEVYNGYVFNEIEGVENVWETNIKVGDRDQRLEIRYHPLDLEHYPYNTDTDQYFYLTQRENGKVTISISNEINELSSNYINLASYDIARILRSFLGYTLEVSSEKDAENEWINCENASINNLVVQMKIGEPRIEADNFCVELYFEEPKESLKISSLLIYNLLGIIE